MRLRAHTPVLWRSQGETQIGLPYRNHVIFDHLTENEQRFLSKVPSLANSRDVHRVAHWCSLSDERAHAFLTTLRSAGLLLDATQSPRTSKEKSWDAQGLSVSEEHQRRKNRAITVCGTSPLAQAIIRLLADDGIGTIHLASGEQITGTCPSPHQRAQDNRCLNALRDELHHAYPDLTVTRQWDPQSLVVVVSSAVTDPLLSQQLAASHTPVFTLVDHPAGVTLGPLINDGRGPCGMCLDLWRTEEDPCWPAIAAQLLTHSQPLTDPITLTYAAALAAQAIIDCADTLTARASTRPAESSADSHSIAWAGRSIALTVGSTHQEEIVWPRHPHCACSLTCSQVVNESVD